MRLVVATFAMLLGAAMLLPAAATPTALAQVAPSASVEPSASPLPGALVELWKYTEYEGTGDWAIAVTGGSPSVDAVTIDDFDAGPGFFTVTVFAESATVEMTATLPASSRLTSGICRRDGDYLEEDALVAPDRLALEVVPGGEYQCYYGSDAPGPFEPPYEGPAPTAPPTDSLAGAKTGSSSGDWPRVLAVMAAVITASLLIAVRARLRR